MKSLIYVKEIATNTLQMLKNWLGENITIDVSIDENLWQIRSQPTYIDQILVNLCVNAKDAMPNGGKLSIKIENYNGKPQDLAFGNYLKFTLKDTGVGMDFDTQKKVFEPFFTTKPIGQGTGLGLSTVYGIVKQHNGNIIVRSEKNIGTIFTIYLPVDKKDIESVKIDQIENNELDFRKIILFKLPFDYEQCLYWCLHVLNINVTKINTELNLDDINKKDCIVTCEQLDNFDKCNKLILPKDTVLSCPILEILQKICAN